MIIAYRHFSHIWFSSNLEPLINWCISQPYFLTYLLFWLGSFYSKATQICLLLTYLYLITCSTLRRIALEDLLSGIIDHSHFRCNIWNFIKTFWDWYISILLYSAIYQVCSSGLGLSMTIIGHSHFRYIIWNLIEAFSIWYISILLYSINLPSFVTP